MTTQSTETGKPNEARGDAETADVKYFFLDIVGYTRNRSVEAQVHIVQRLNEAVTAALESTKEEGREVILLPTGDGMAVALVNPSSYDIHLRTGLEVIKNIARYNQTNANDPMRQLQVRIGINENVDNVVLDINGRRNVAGNGIAMAQRIMDKADGMQVLVSESVYAKLSPRERYMKSFERFAATGKHGVTFSVFQYITEAEGLNRNTPSVFSTKTPDSLKYSHLVAYYIAEACTHKKFLISRKGDTFRDEAATVALYYLGHDRVAEATAQEHESPVIQAWGKGQSSFEEQYEHYAKLDTWPLCDLSRFITEKHLLAHEDLFDVAGPLEDALIFPNAAGLAKLKKEWPEIAKEFEL